MKRMFTVMCCVSVVGTAVLLGAGQQPKEQPKEGQADQQFGMRKLDKQKASTQLLGTWVPAGGLFGDENIDVQTQLAVRGVAKTLSYHFGSDGRFTALSSDAVDPLGIGGGPVAAKIAYGTYQLDGNFVNMSPEYSNIKMMPSGKPFVWHVRTIEETVVVANIDLGSGRIVPVAFSRKR